MRPVLLLALLALAVPRGAGADGRLRAATSSRPPAASARPRRRLGVADWWASLLNALHVPCPSGSSEDHPTGHCAHSSHHVSGGGSGSGGGGSGGDDSGGGNDDDGGDDDDADDGAGAAENDDGGGDDAWADDGHDAANDDAANNDAANDDAGDAANDDAAAAADDAVSNDADDLWQNDGWESHNLNASTRGRYSRGGGGRGWGLAALLAGAVGGMAFALTRKRERQERDTSRVPQDVYVRDGVGSAVDADGGDDGAVEEAVEEATVRSGRSRASTLRSAISRKSSFLRAKLGRRTPITRAASGDGSIATDEGGAAGFVAMTS